MFRVFQYTIVRERNYLNQNVSSLCNFSSTVAYRNNVSDSSQIKPVYQHVPDFYAGKSVFLTGATGFIGRVMIERLLYTCKDIDKLYILIREKKNMTISQRVQEILNNPIFTKLKQTRPQDLNKIVPIAGDVADPKLGLNLEDEETLIDKVSVVFHSAAQVRFLAPIKELWHINYEGTKKVMDLSQKMRNLDIFVYVSTAYANGDTNIEEIPYPAPKKMEEVYRILEKQGDNPKETRKLLDFYGNSYVFSKKMTEAYVVNNHGNMPTVIVRPSMVTSVYKDPLPGYVDSWVAGTGLLCDIAAGYTRVIYGTEKVLVDVIPCDYVCNFLIVTAAKNNRTKECLVYNMAPGDANPINLKRLSRLFIREGKKNDYVVMPFPKLYFGTKSKKTIAVIQFFTGIIPAFMADTWLRLTGKTPRYMKLQKSANSRVSIAWPVTYKSWYFKTARARHLISTLEERDRSMFPCDPTTIDWDKYVPIYCKGVKQYMLKNKNQK